MALVAVGATVTVVSETIAEEEALRDAAGRSTGVARGVTAPLVTDGVRSGAPGAVRRLTRTLEDVITHSGIEHIIVWDADGSVLWADDPSFIGRSSPLPPEALAALHQPTARANLPQERDLAAEDPFGRPDQIEVFVGFTGADGKPALFEAYVPPDVIAQDREAVLPRLLLVGLGSLLLYQLMLLPILVVMQLRVGEARRARQRLLLRSLATWHHQRRLLAQELHDGVIQDLAAVGYGVSALGAEAMPAQPRRDLAARLQQSVRTIEVGLRTMVLDLVPGNLAGDGLGKAVAALVGPSDAAGLAVTLEVPSDLAESEATLGLAYRVIREGLRNVHKHAAAKAALIRVAPRERGLLVEVVDDGPYPPAEGQPTGQGLLLLGSAVDDAGGWLRLERAEGGGTALRALVPSLAPSAHAEHA